MYEFRYDYANPKYGDKLKLCYTYTDKFIVYVKSWDVYGDLVGYVEKRFDTSNCEAEETTTHRKKQKSDETNEGRIR